MRIAAWLMAGLAVAMTASAEAPKTRAERLTRFPGCHSRPTSAQTAANHEEAGKK